MSEISHLLKQGWKNLWRVKFVWLFILISSLNSLLYSFPQLALLGLCGLPFAILGFLLYIVGFTGVIYIAFHTTNGETVTLRETLLGVRKFFGRVTSFYILLGFLGAALVMPFICSLVIFTDPNPTQISRLRVLMVPITFILGIFSAFFYLPIIDIVAKDSRVRNSIASAWKIFKGHPGLFLRIGLVYSVILAIVQIINAPPLLNFDLAALGAVNPLDVAVSSNYLFANILIVIVGQILFAYFGYVFTLAYFEKSSDEN